MLPLQSRVNQFFVSAQMILNVLSTQMNINISFEKNSIFKMKKKKKIKLYRVNIQYESFDQNIVCIRCLSLHIHSMGSFHCIY